jgi:NADP-dependent 3-hydroxy acid dehydrogenase YdfG
MEVKPYNIRTTVISPDSFARAVVFAMSQPEDVDINEILFRPTRQEL